jgi:hypothetical protein
MQKHPLHTHNKYIRQAHFREKILALCHWEFQAAAPLDKACAEHVLIRYVTNVDRLMSRGPKPLGERAMTAAERQARFRAAHADGSPKIRYRRPGDRRSRPQRWHDAVAELVTLQEDYRAWLDALPDSLQESATAEA